MKKILIGSLALASVVLLSSCEMPGQSDEKMEGGVKPENTMMKDADAMMKKEDAPQDAMMKKEDTTADGMMKADVKVESGAMMQK